MMSNIKEKISLSKNDNSEKLFNRALYKAGAIIIAGYLFGTFIAWLITR